MARRSAPTRLPLPAPTSAGAIPPFEIPADVYAAWNGKPRGEVFESNWNRRFEAYQAAFPAEAAEFKRRMAGELPADWAAKSAAAIAEIAAKAENIATRKASQRNRRLRAAAAGTDRRFGRPRRLRT